MGRSFPGGGFFTPRRLPRPRRFLPFGLRRGGLEPGLDTHALEFAEQPLDLDILIGGSPRVPGEKPMPSRFLAHVAGVNGLNAEEGLKDLAAGDVIGRLGARSPRGAIPRGDLAPRLLPSAMAAVDPESVTLAYRDRMAEEARKHLPGRIGVGIDGFADS